MWQPDSLTLSMLLTIFFGLRSPKLPSDLEFLIFVTTLFGLIFFGGAFAGIATLIITKKSNFFIEIFRLLIGAMGGYECVLIYILLNSSFKNPNEIFELIIGFHHGILQTLINFYQVNWTFFIPGVVGAIGASIAIFMMRKVFGWRL
ncbi:MAG: hypothetical protein HWQ41_09570 [Nostoc sp. NOS(2021)]|uniref:hypothetical protein n=1 Tax=Nostoc sp. NOS(2021) TaxID=2815407 RepID=UPI0025DC34C0|nr:hypothetical protein [Nostoc sp. NOS(2021)]MBN3895496.1 hypothetical protein [Nostoc sp. NOS(2021)]